MTDTTHTPYVVILPTNTSSGATSDVFLREKFYVHSIQTYCSGVAATVTVYGSNNGTHWSAIGSALPGNSITQIIGLYKYLKVTRDGTTNPVLVTCLSGHNFRK